VFLNKQLHCFNFLSSGQFLNEKPTIKLSFRRHGDEKHHILIKVNKKKRNCLFKNTWGLMQPRKNE